jgi:CheY-like chemotaxis protein
MISSRPASSPSGRTILLIDDERSMMTAYRTVLEDLGHQVLVAFDGREALELLGKVPAPDLILLDCSMPGMSGEQFLDELDHRAPSVTRQTRIIGFSSFPAGAPFMRAFERLVDDFETKPLELEEFVSLVERQLNQANLGL